MMRVRAACHVHSDWSYDGKWSLEKLAEAFSKRGYQVVMITEHDRGFDEKRRLEHREACRKASTERILLVPGIEYSDKANCVHTLVWGNVPFVGVDVETEKVLAAVTAHQAVAVMAHPSRKQAWRAFNPAWGANLLGIELWNRKTDGWAPSRDAAALLETTGALPFVGLDFHERRQFFPLATILEMEPSLSEASVLASMSARRCSSEVFGRPLPQLCSGVPARTLRTAERFRRGIAPIFRQVFPRY
jgi:hypothetical protein